MLHTEHRSLHRMALAACPISIAASLAATAQDLNDVGQLAQFVRWSGVVLSLFVVVGSMGLLRMVTNISDRFSARFAHRLVQFGFAPSRSEYQAWLRSADLVLSTAEHEFQGLAVLEALAAGCLPVLPNRLVYPEFVPPSGLYADAGGDIAAEARHAVDLIERQARSVPLALERSGAMVDDSCLPAQLRRRFAWSHLKSDYESVMLSLAGARAGI